MTFVFGRSAIDVNVSESVECQVKSINAGSLLAENQLLGIRRSANCCDHVRLCESSFTGVCDTREQLRNMGGDIVRIFTDLHFKKSAIGLNR